MASLTGRKDTPPGRRQRTRALTTILLAIFLLYTFLPLFYLIISSTKNNSELFSSFGLWFASAFHLFSNLEEVFTYGGGVYVNWLWNTAYYSVSSALGASLVATAAGYAFAKFRFHGRTLVFAIILGAVMIPQTALAIPRFLLLSKVGLVDTPFAVILPSLVFPLGVYLMRVYAEQAIPDDLLDAARVDGAGEVRIFFSVAFRILTPGFVTVLLLAFVATWNNYFLPLVVLSTPKFYPLTVGLASWNQQASAGGGAQSLYPLVMTGALVGVVPVAIAFLFLQRFWQGGLSLGSIK
ncbi:MAG: carbohydrate ABC transporter permease [Rubrobacteraceae bacterium]